MAAISSRVRVGSSPNLDLQFSDAATKEGNGGGELGSGRALPRAPDRRCGALILRPYPAHASICGPEKGGGPTESHAFRDAGGAGPLGGRPFPPSRERRRGACRVRAA